MSEGTKFHPAEFIKEELEERGWSKETLAQKAMLGISTVDELLAGKRRVTPIVAYGLELAFGVNKQMWLNLQKSYDGAKEGRMSNYEAEPDDTTPITVIPTKELCAVATCSAMGVNRGQSVLCTRHYLAALKRENQELREALNRIEVERDALLAAAEKAQKPADDKASDQIEPAAL